MVLRFLQVTTILMKACSANIWVVILPEWVSLGMTGVALGSDAFFPFGDNIERAHKSGVSYIAQPGGSVRDDHVIGTCDKYNMAMAFTGIRLFHH